SGRRRSCNRNSSCSRSVVGAEALTGRNVCVNIGGMRSPARRLAAATLSVAAAVTALTVPTSTAAPLPGNTGAFRGVNCADPRDNYAHDAVVPSGLSTADDYATTYRKADGIVGEFRKELRANTVRLPINPSSVGTAWWNSYRGAIDAAVGRGFNVILSYWEADNAKDGRVDATAAYGALWE